jgi:hypothetical protein
MRLKLRAGLIAAFALIVCSPGANAGDPIPVSLEAGLAPFATHPSNYPESFSGMGIAVGASIAPFASWKEAIEINYLSQGQASLLTLQYRHYVTGVVQYTTLPSSMNVNLRHSGWYFEGGAALYNLTSTNLTSGALSTIEGTGLTFGMGWEFPFWGKAFVSPQIGYLNSVGGIGYYGINTAVLVGIPINF